MDARAKGVKRPGNTLANARAKHLRTSLDAFATTYSTTPSSLLTPPASSLGDSDSSWPPSTPLTAEDHGGPGETPLEYPTPSSEDTLGVPNIVCCGMIYQVKCQLMPTVRHASEAQIDRALPAGPVAHLILSQQSDCYTVSLPNGQTIALINCRIALVFDKLRSSAGVSLKVYMSRKDLANALQAATKVTKKTELLLVNVNVHGPSIHSETLGDLLSTNDVFLQEPVWTDPEVPYLNPHVLEFPDISENDMWVRNLTAHATSQKTLANHEWNNALDELPQYQANSYLDDNGSLTVPLHPHQNDGRDFILRRETGQLRDIYRYWKHDHSSFDGPIYRHTVTGAERLECQTEPAGGILADDMGLGKTLTIISAILASVERAAIYKNQLHQSERPPTKATLVVVPSMLILENWAAEIKSRTKPGVLRVTTYHGHERAQHHHDLLDADIVLTTYGTVATEHRRPESRKVLYHLSWFRVVLDEAHTIRSQNTKQFSAIYSLSAQHHWCLTGTPIANKIDDIGALLRFCRVPLLEDRTCFRENIVKTAKRSFHQGCTVLRQTLLPICLRRNKDVVRLPRPILRECVVSFTDAESRVYRDMMRASKREIDATVAAMENMKKKKHTVLQAILRLRRVCNHGTFEDWSHPTSRTLDPDELWTLFEENGEVCCIVCDSAVNLVNQMADISSGWAGACGHIACRSCLLSQNTAIRHEGMKCPTCETEDPHAHIELEATSVTRPHAFASSSKLNSVVDNLGTTASTEKSLVFSVWKKTIDIVSRLCTLKGIRHVRIDGTTPQSGRREALDQFINDPETSVLLMTFGTGALGLNLTAATRIHIVEAQWNPTVEEQAIGRAIRIGQKHETTIIRYMVKGTLEEQIQGYQNRKKHLAAAGFGEDSKAQDEAHTELLNVTFLNQNG